MAELRLCSGLIDESELLQLAQECLKEYTSFVDMLTSEKLLTKKEVSDANVWFAAVTGLLQRPINTGGSSGPSL